jgi:hypothetical protein
VDHSQGLEFAPVEDRGEGLVALRREVDLRQQALERLRLMNLRHAAHAWQRRNSDPIAPYGLAFLYAQHGPDPSKPWLSLSAATKLWLVGDETRDLPRLLYGLNQTLAGNLHSPGSFDVRTQLANRMDATMAKAAWYVGLGVSSLDTSTGRWEQVLRQVDSDLDIPSTIRIILIDGTITVAERRGASEFHQMWAASSQPLTIDEDIRFLNWSPVSDQAIRADPQHETVLRWMEELHTTVWRLDLGSSGHTPQR